MAVTPIAFTNRPRLTKSSAANVRAAVAAMPPARNPAINKTAFDESPESVREMLAEAFSPANGGNLSEAPIVRDNTPLAVALQNGWLPGYENDARLNPSQSKQRTPEARFKVLGSPAQAFLAGATNTITWTPQTDFQGVRLIIPSSLQGGNISNILVGVNPIYVAAGKESNGIFSELSTAGIIDFPVCKLGQKISAQVQMTAASTFYSAIIGQAADGLSYTPLFSPLMRLPITPQTIAASATTIIQLQPQTSFKIRKFVVDSTEASNFLVNFLNVGIQTQFDSGDPVPALVFSELGQDIWMDGDEAKPGNIIAVSVTNLDAANPHSFEGALLGDVREYLQLMKG